MTQYNFDKMDYYLTPKCILMYENLFTPRENKRADGSIDRKFDVVLLINKEEAKKDQKFLALYNAVIALKEAKAKGYDNVYMPIRDGNQQYEKDHSKYAAFKDCFSIHAKNKFRPLIGNEKAEEISESLGNRDQIYRGCYVWAKVKPYYVHNPKYGVRSVGLDLGNVQKIADGAPLFNKRSLEDDFQALPEATIVNSTIEELPGIELPSSTGSSSTGSSMGLL